MASKLAWLASKRNAILVAAAVFSSALGLADGVIPTLGFWEGT